MKKTDKKIGRVIGPINENGKEVGYLTSDTASGIVRAIYYSEGAENRNTVDFSLTNDMSDKEKKIAELQAQINAVENEVTEE